jgi:ankyrin repeat protein
VLHKGCLQNVLCCCFACCLLLLPQGHAGVVQQLLAAGAEVDALHDDSSTALHLAAGLGREKVAQLLLKARVRE